MKKWVIKTTQIQKEASEIAKNLNISEKVAQIFVERGLNTTQKVKEFLDFDETDIPDISLLMDSDKAINRIEEAVNLGEHIVIYADYDADGTCACSIMIRALRHLGAHVDYYTNDRLRQGFGMKVDGVDEILARYPDVSLIVTVDNGIVAFDAAEHIAKKHIDLIITDHHEPDASGTLPMALAVVDHKRYDDKYPFKEICGTGIAYRLMKALYEQRGEKMDYIYDLLPLVAVGTVADCVSMTGENRYYVKQGLRKMGEETIPAFGVLSSLFKVKQYNEDTIGFYFGPMINSSSRLVGNAMKPIKFFTSDDADEVLNLGTELYELNEKRKTLTVEKTDLAESMVESQNKSNNNVIVLYDPSFEEGIVGIIAGRITEKYHKPSIVFTDNDGRLKGSARSVEGFNIKEAFDELAAIIVNYGGHAMAAGITIEPEDLDEFDTFINNYADGKIPEAKDDIEIGLSLDSPDEINTQLLDSYNNYLRPFGTDWPVVKTRVGGWSVGPNSVRALKDIHLKITNTLDYTDYGLLMFNDGVEYLNNLLGCDILTDTSSCPVETLEGIGEFDINVFKGNISYQFIVKDGQLRIQK